MSTGEGLGGGKDEIPNEERELVRQIMEAAKSDSTEVGAKIRSLDLGIESGSSTSPSKEAPYDFEKDKEFSAKLTKLRHEYFGLPEHFRQTYKTQFDKIFGDIEERYGVRDYDGAAKFLPALEKQIKTAEGLLDDRERHSVEARKRRLASRDIPEKWLGEANQLFKELEKCLDESIFERTADLFKQLDTAIVDAGGNWIGELRKQMEKDFESVKVGAPVECIEQLNALSERASKHQEKGEFGDATATLEELVEYIHYVADEKLRIAEEERERLQREAEERERQKQLTIKQNTRRIEELTKQYEGYASLLKGVSTTAAEALEKIVKACKEKALKLELDSEDAGQKLDDFLGDEVEESLGSDFFNVVDDLEKYKSVIVKSLIVGSEDTAQVKLSKTWNEIKSAIEDKDYDAPLNLFKEVGRLLAEVEGEETYNSLLLAVQPKYERIRDDSTDWLPTQIKTLLDEAQKLATSEKYSQANAKLRKIEPIVGNVDSVTMRFGEIEADYEELQDSKATKEQKKAVEKLLRQAQTACTNSKFTDALNQLDVLESKIDEVKTTTDRRTDPNRFPNVVAKAPKGGGMSDLNVVATKLSEGGITADEIMNLIPAGTKQNWKTNPSDPDRYKSGFKYEWIDSNGKECHIHGHSKDTKHDESTNSGSGAVVRICIDKMWLRSDGTLTEVLYDDKAHIPLF